MKRSLSLFLAAVCLLFLFGCGGKTPQQGSASAAPGMSGSSGSASQSQAPVGVEPAPGPEGTKYLCASLNYGRLYAIPMDGGEKKLLADRMSYCFARRDDEVLASFEDGTIHRFDLTTGSDEIVLSMERPANEILWCDSGFICVFYTMANTQYWFCDGRSGKLTHLVAAEDSYDLKVVGDTALFFRYVQEEGESFLISYDIFRDRENWRIVSQQIYATRVLNGTFYLCWREYEYGDFGNASDTYWYTVEPERGTMYLTALPFDVNRYSLQFVGNGGCLVESDYEDGFRMYFAGDGGVTALEFGEPYDYCLLEDSRENTLLLRAVCSGTYETRDGEERWYQTERRYLMSAYDGTIRAVDALDVNQQMFLTGDFPLIDSSTARKPVTRQLYELFCLSSGAGGAEPLCSTTHNAWLNIADRKADFALLAAPTQEEQDYLKARNVAVEMKLYGGDGLVFIGNRACGVENMTLEQLRAIFRGEITNWAQLGGVDHEIRVLYRDDQSGSQRLFERLLFQGQDVPDLAALGFERLDEMGTIVSECIYDPYAIGYSIMTYLNDVLEYSELLSFRLEGYDATPENVRAGAYPLCTRGYAVIRADEGKDSPARRLFDWFNSPVCDDILTANGVVPVHGQDG